MTDIVQNVSLKGIEAVVKERKKIFGTLQQAVTRAITGKVTVAIFGLGGVGKTTTKHLLVDGADGLAKNAEYVPTVHSNKKAAKENFFVSVWDTPGQESFRESAWDDALKSVQASKRVVLVNVVSYGYNTPHAPFSLIRRSSSKSDDKEVIRNYLRLERASELALIKRLAGLVHGYDAKIHLLTVVNKQDLWWSQRDKVTLHYNTGSYGRVLAKLAVSKAGRNFTYSFASACLCHVNLRATDGFVMAQTCSGYDGAMREVHLGHLVKTLEELVK